jgi:hypothetical protein
MKKQSGPRLATEKRGEEIMTIEERMVNLELQMGRFHRRNRWMIGAVLLLAGGLVIPTTIEMSAFRARAQVAPAKEIRASKFVLQDETGSERAVLAYDKNGVALELTDENETPRAQLMVIKEGPVLNLRDEEGRVRVQITKLNTNSMAGISFYNENGVSIAQLNLTRSGFPALTLSDQDAKPRIMIGVVKTEPIIRVMDETGKVVWSATK